MTTSKICGIAEIRTAKAAKTATTSTTAHFKCAISNFVVGRAGKNETEVFLLHLVVPSLPSFPSLQCRVVVSLQNTKNDWWPWKSFSGRSVGTVHTKGLHSTPPSIALLLPPPTFSVLNEVLPLLSYSLGRSAKRHIRRCWSTKYGGRDRTTGTKNRAPHSLRVVTITILVVLRLRRRFLTSPVRLSAIRYNAVMSQRLRAILS